MISDQRIAFLAENGVNQRELTVTRDIFEKAGIRSEIISTSLHEIKGWEGQDWGIRIKVDKQVSEIAPEEYDGMIIPGGALHADYIRSQEQCQYMVKQFFGEGKLIGTIGHGIQLLLSTGVLSGLKTSCPSSLKRDLQFGSAICMDEPVTIDNGLVTCCNEEHLETFTRLFLDSLRKGIKQRTESII